METRGSPSVIAFTLDRGRISEIDVVRNPDKLGTLTVSTVRQSA